MKTTLLFVACLANLGLCLDFHALTNVAAGVTRAAYPDADSVVVDDLTCVTYETNGASRTWGETCVKILTEKGKRENRTVTLGYNVAYGTAVVDHIEVIKPDGTVITVNVAAQSREMVDDSQMGMNIYDPNNKRLSVGVPGLEIGDVLVYSLRRAEHKPRMPNTWSDYSIFEYNTPIVHARQEVSGPAALPLQHTLLKAALSNTVQFTQTSSGATNYYVWDARAVPQMFPEPSMPAMHTVVQRLLLSTIPDWQTVSRWYDELCEPRLRATTPAMTNVVAELTAGLATPHARLEAIFHYVSQKIRYMGITTETEAPGYEPHDVAITFNNKYGVCRDKAALLAALLRMAGFKAYPVLIYVGPKKDEEVPQPYFNHAIVAVEDADGSYILMDPTDENTRELLPSYLCNCSYLVAKPAGDGLRVSPIIPATENMLAINTRAQLNRDGDLRAEATLQFNGINDNAYRGFFARLKEDERRRVFEGIVKRIAPGATLDQLTVAPANMLDTTTNLHVRLAYSAKGVLVEGARAALLPPLWVGSAFGVVNMVIGQTGLETRKYPLVTKFACGVREQFTLQVGAAVGAPLTMPHYETLDGSNLLWQIGMQMSNGVLRGTSDFQVRSVEFTPPEYAALKAALKTIEFDRRKRAIFAPAARDRDADVDLLEHTTEYDLRALTQMVVTTRVRKKILTYSGKKSNAELTLGYNPVWDSVTLEHAVTITTGGVETAIAKEAQNVMDASWVANAPRYPASKTLVANLPAVDIGSTIAYRTRRVLTGRPFWSFSEAFRGFEPIERQTVRLIVPRDMVLNITNTRAGAPACQVSDQGETLTYTWQAHQQTALKEEDELPPWWSFIEGILVSGGRWEEYANVVQAALVLATEQQDQACARAHALCGTTNDPAARVTIIRDWIEKNIRLAGPALVELPLACVTPADRTLRDGYGNNSDRAVLYFTMLKAVGVAPEFVLASWEPILKGMKNPTLLCPQRTTFSDVLVRVTVDNKAIYLNDTDQYDILGATIHDGRYGLVLPRGALVAIAALPAARDKAELRYTLRLDAQGDATIAREQRFRGTAYGRFHQRFAELPPEERRRLYLEMVAAISQAARASKPLVTEYAAYPGTEKFTVQAARYAVRDGAFIYATLPDGGAGVPGVRSDTRENPLYWSSPLRQTTRYTVVLPPAFCEVQLAPQSLTWQAPMGGKIVFSTVQHSNIVEIVRMIDLKPAIIAAFSYPELLEVNRALAHPAMRTILATEAK